MSNPTLSIIQHAARVKFPTKGLLIRDRVSSQTLLLLKVTWTHHGICDMCSATDSAMHCGFQNKQKLWQCLEKDCYLHCWFSRKCHIFGRQLWHSIVDAMSQGSAMIGCYVMQDNVKMDIASQSTFSIPTIFESFIIPHIQHSNIHTTDFSVWKIHRVFMAEISRGCISVKNAFKSTWYSIICTSPYGVLQNPPILDLILYCAERLSFCTPTKKGKGSFLLPMEN